MARSRNLKPGFFTNEELALLPEGAQLLFAGLWTIADREGRLEDRPSRIQALLFPYKKKPVDKWLALLADASFIIRYETDGRRYIQIANFSKHQTPHIKEPESLIPAPDMARYSAECAHESSTYIGRGNQHSGIRKQETGNSIQQTERGRASFEPPSVDAVAAYCAERKNSIDAQTFVDFYTSKGWKVGNQPMKDWQAAVRTWERNRRSNEPKSADDPRGNIAALQRYVEDKSNGDDDQASH